MIIIHNIHSYLAYFVLTILLITVINSFIGWFSNSHFSTKDLRISLFALILTHIQLLIGFILYFVSPNFSEWQKGVANVMGNSSLRLYLVEHPITNIFGVFLITIGWSLHKRQPLSNKRFLRIGLFYFLGLILFFFQIPWSK